MFEAEKIELLQEMYQKYVTDGYDPDIAIQTAWDEIYGEDKE